MAERAPRPAAPPDGGAAEPTPASAGDPAGSSLDFNEEVRMRSVLRTLAVLLLVTPLAALIWPRRAETVPLYAARTGLMCQTCHFDPNGGGPRNEFGFAFARNRHAITPEPDGPWADLDLTNRVGETMPVYFGVNQRFMLIANTTVQSDSLDRLGFYSMENALHITFQPHPRLTLVYSRGGFEANASVGEAFGMISGFPLDGYLKAGRIRNPFGLRMDDHTVATRNSYLDFSSDPFSPRRFLPYDPRAADEGFEYGMSSANWFGRVAFTNGGSNGLLGPNTFAEGKTIKLGYNAPWYQGGASFYDDYQKNPLPFGDPIRRATRWGYYGLAHYGPVAMLGEIVAGTDDRESGAKTNLLALFVEADYSPARPWNFRARFDHLEMDRSSDPVVRDLATSNRYSLEGEVVPVPFAELRWTLRHIEYQSPQDSPAFSALGRTFDKENQAYLQAHFSY